MHRFPMQSIQRRQARVSCRGYVGILHCSKRFSLRASNRYFLTGISLRRGSVKIAVVERIDWRFIQSMSRYSKYSVMDVFILNGSFAPFDKSSFVWRNTVL